MKNCKKMIVLSGIIVFIVVIGIFVNTSITSVEEKNYNCKSGKIQLFSNQPPTMSYLDSSLINATNIFIDDSSSVWNWTCIKANYTWCTGSGTVGDPYLISDAIFFGNETTDYCLTIQNSIAYFEIVNCNFTVESGVHTCDNGLSLNDVGNGTISECSAYGVDRGFDFLRCSNITMDTIRCICQTDYYIYSDQCYNLTIQNSIFYASSKCIYICDNSEDTIIDNNRFYGNDITQQSMGIVDIDMSIYANITNNIFSDINGSAITVMKSDHDYVYNNIMTSNMYGFSVVCSESSYVYFYNNEIKTKNTILLMGGLFTSMGFFFMTAITNCTIESNSIQSEGYGILFYSMVINTTVYDNTIKDCDTGISVETSCSYNTIHNNYFLENTIQAEDNDLAVTNHWDNGAIGNYWSDYEGYDNNGDGIGDTPYDISGSAETQDNYPIWNIAQETVSKTESKTESPVNSTMTFLFIVLITLFFVVFAVFRGDRKIKKLLRERNAESSGKRSADGIQTRSSKTIQTRQPNKRFAEKPRFVGKDREFERKG